MAQGFVVALNLGEMNTRDLDTLALNNLGGDGTARDLSLFSNNNNNFSVMKPERSFSISNVTVDGSRIIYESQTDFRAGMIVDITGIDPVEYNKESARISVASDSAFEVLDSFASSYDPYVSGGSVVGADYKIVDTNYISRANEEQVVFSNKTKIIHEGTEYTVINSDGNDKFQLIDDQENIFVPTGELIRSDLITSQNVENLRPSVLRVVTNQESEDNEDAFSPPTLGVESTDVLPLADRITLIDLYSSVFDQIDSYLFRRKISIVMNDEVNFDVTLNFDSTVTVKNTQNLDITSPNTPGIYIYNGTNSTRAFSDNSDPWETTEQESGYTTTEASVATIRKLVLSNPDFESLTTNISTGDVADTYTHKVPVKLNDGTGERTYYLLVEEI